MKAHFQTTAAGLATWRVVKGEKKGEGREEARPLQQRTAADEAERKVRSQWRVKIDQ